MAAEIKQEFPDTEVQLVGGSGGVFEVTAGDSLVFSKKKLGRHAEPGEVVGLLRKQGN
ncbi:MAG: Rdx family protein [Gemmatimonadota bacterium]|nr:MAG: Rdx family protein [Gemmatimonadota bacterium]